MAGTLPVVDLGLVAVDAELESRGALVTYSAGSRIFEQGQAGDCAYMIERGYVEVSRYDGGAKTVLGLLGPGEVFGEMALLDGEPRSASAFALHETTLVSISRSQLHEVFDQASPLARLLAIAAISRLRSTPPGSTAGAGPAPAGEGAARVGQRYASARADAARAVRMRLDLESAIERQQFELVYQPIVELADGRTSGFEALVRWPRPGGAPVSPADFIPLAETTGLIVPLGQWVLEAGLRALSVVGRRGPAFMSVNVSPRQLDSEEHTEALARVIEQADVDPALVKLEITEQTLLDDPRMATIGLARLKATGAKIAIDDFGTGYSSLNYLHRFPLDTLKIDRSFVRKIHADPGGQRVVSAIIGLARELEMDVVAEGIEEVEELRWLQLRGCRFGQGYLMARPSTLHDAMENLERPFEW